MNPQTPTPTPASASDKKPMRKLTMLSYLFWIGIAGFLISTCGDKEDKPTERDIRLAQTPEGKMKLIAEKQFEKGFRNVEIDKITGGPQEGKYNVDVTYTNQFYQKILTDDEFKKAFRAFFSSGVPVWEVWLRKNGKLVDKFGKETEELLYKVSMTQEVANKINWNNAHLLDFSQLWQVHFLHPAAEE